MYFLQTGRKMLQALTDLYEFGYTAYKDLMDKTKLYPSQCELREAKDFVSFKAYLFRGVDMNLKVGGLNDF